MRRERTGTAAETAPHLGSYGWLTPAHPRGPVQLSVIALNVLYAIIGVVLMYLSYRVIDLLTPEVDFRAELQKGNVAVAIFMASIFISIALIIGKALG